MKVLLKVYGKSTMKLLFGRTALSIITGPYWLMCGSKLASPGVFVCAYLNSELVGFAELLRDSSTITVSQILSFTTHRDKAVNNALIAKTVECAVSVGVCFVVYARFGNHPTLDEFKRSNGFESYYVEGQGKLFDFVPNRLKVCLIPVYNWFSRLKVGGNK